MSDYCDTCKYKNDTFKHHCGICVATEVTTKNGTTEIKEPTEYVKFDEQVRIKGYIYDSLVYRYKFALERGVNEQALEIMENDHNSCHDMKVARGIARERNERDVLRFCQILDEVIGEHD